MAGGWTAPRLIAVIAVAVALAVGVVVALLPRGDPDPYVVTAIDYHFHDAHPTLPLTQGRDLVIKNAGRNRHNVTIPALGYSRAVGPGAQRTIADIASRLAPGRYELFCELHVDRGMRGVIVIAAH